MTLSSPSTSAAVALPPASGTRAMASLLAASAALLVLTLAWGLVDGRTIAGDPVWLKPAKFAFSFVVLFGTLALIQGRLSPPWADGWTLRITTWVMAAAFAFEMAYMTYQAARGVGSHFNFATDFEVRMYQLMGLGALALVFGIGAYGIAALRDRAARMSPGLRRAVGLGLLATVVLTLPTAGYLGSNGSHFVGTLPADPRAIPILGWSGSVGDLRPAHFLALHAMQAIPLYALWRERGGRAIGTAEITGVTLAFGALTLAVFAQALAGYPLLPL